MTAYVPGVVGSAAVVAPSGDITGAKDYSRLVAAVAALPSFTDGFAYGTIQLTNGSYYFNAPVPNIGPHVQVNGTGTFSTFLFPVWTNNAASIGAASSFSAHGPSQNTGDFSTSTFGGGFTNLTIDGSLVNNNSNTTYPAVGLDMGDIQQPNINGLRIQNFSTNTAAIAPAAATGWSGSGSTTVVVSTAYPGVIGQNVSLSGFTSTNINGGPYPITAVSAGVSITVTVNSNATGSTSAGTVTQVITPLGGPMIGLWLRNYAAWSEKWNGTGVSLLNNDNALTIDVTRSGGTGARGNSGTFGNASHEFGNMDLYLYQAAEQNGISVQGGCSVGSGQWRISGNYEKCTSSTTYVLNVSGTVPAGYPGSGTAARMAMLEFALGLTQGDPYTRANTPFWIQTDSTATLIWPKTSIRMSNISHTSIAGGAVVLIGGSSQQASIGTNQFGNYADAAQTAMTATTGAATASQPWIGATYKKVVVYLNAYTNTGTSTYAFPTGFVNTPIVASNTTSPAATPTVTAAHIVLPIVGSASTGYIILEGY